VLTRCRGPLIWLEDEVKGGADRWHPLLQRLHETLAEGRRLGRPDIDFIHDEDE
jgi:hypothetical protein